MSQLSLLSLMVWTRYWGLKSVLIFDLEVTPWCVHPYYYGWQFKIRTTTTYTCEYTTKWLTISLPSSRASVNGHHWDKNTASCFCIALNMLKYSPNAQISTGIDFLHEKINITHAHFKDLKADIKPVTLVPVKKLYVWQVIVKALCVFLSLRKFCRNYSMAIN